MGNRVARLATPPCFAPPDADDDAQHYTATATAADDGVCHIFSFDGRDGGGRIRGVLLPSNPSTSCSAAAAAALSDRRASSLSFSGSSSFDSSNSFSFRTLHSRQYSGPLDSSAFSPSTSTLTSATNSGVSSLSRRLPAAARTDEQILADLYATRQRHRLQQQASSGGGAARSLLSGLRRAAASVIRAARRPCVPAAVPSAGKKSEPELHAAAAVGYGNGNGNGNGHGGAAIGQRPDDGGGNGGAAAAAAAARVEWARGKAGEDRVHVVVSSPSEHGGGWTFVGIYDGFHGPDATDYLLSHLYSAVCRELHADGGAAALLLNHHRHDDDQDDSGDDDVHDEVLAALARALRTTEAGYFADAEARAADCPELAMMGSCVLVALLTPSGHLYVMNVGDSRALLATSSSSSSSSSIKPVQLSEDHSVSSASETARIRREHGDDDPARIIENGRVKGALKVTRAFGAGYLKHPRWNDALLEVFRVPYVGNEPYVTCTPDLRHHRVDGDKDRFLVLASDGLYDYLSNDEVVAQVHGFVQRWPDRDPAKFLSHLVLLRAADQAGMGFHELLEVQQGDRRRYHDDVSIIIISLEGKIWRSST